MCVKKREQIRIVLRIVDEIQRRAVLHHSHTLCKPLAAPRKVVLLRSAVLVCAIVLTDVERRVCDDEVNGLGLKLPQFYEAVVVDDGVSGHRVSV
jgi:hypothetical protein